MQHWMSLRPDTALMAAGTHFLDTVKEAPGYTLAAQPRQQLHEQARTQPPLSCLYIVFHVHAGISATLWTLRTIGSFTAFINFLYTKFVNTNKYWHHINEKLMSKCVNPVLIHSVLQYLSTVWCSSQVAAHPLHVTVACPLCDARLRLLLTALLVPSSSLPEPQTVYSTSKCNKAFGFKWPTTHPPVSSDS